MDFRREGIKVLHRDALRSLMSVRHERDDGVVTTYRITINPAYDDLDDMNLVMGLPTEVIEQFKNQSGTDRYATRVEAKSTPAYAVESENSSKSINGEYDETHEEPTRPLNGKIIPQDKNDPFVVGCQDRRDTAHIKRSLKEPMNPVLKEGHQLQKFIARAGSQTTIHPACPRVIESTEPSTTQQGSETSHGSNKVIYLPKRDRSQQSHRAQVPPRWPTVKASVTRIRVKVDGVSVYDSPT